MPEATRMECFAYWLAWVLPHEVVYWCAIRVGSHATQGKWSSQDVPELRFMDALYRWKVEAKDAR